MARNSDMSDHSTHPGTTARLRFMRSSHAADAVVTTGCDGAPVADVTARVERAGSTDELLTIERVGVLQRAPLFESVPGRALVAVARLMEEIRFETGEVVIQRGALEDWIFVVAEGAVRVQRDDRTLAIVSAGGSVGELAVLSPAPRAATVTASEASLLLRLRKEPFDELLDDHPEIAHAVIAALAKMLQASADGQVGSS
jgi:hypothetical protein